jgi:hypothetical protein
MRDGRLDQVKVSVLEVTFLQLVEVKFFEVFFSFELLSSGPSFANLLEQ